MNTRTGRRAFTLIEMVATIGALGILALIGVKTWGGLHASSADVQFRKHVGMLNTAVNVYLANAGDLSGSLTGSQVIDKLKSVADAESSRKINGLRGRALDVTLVGVLQSPAEAASDQKRAIWSAETMRFEIAESGSAGFNRFYLDEDAPAENTEEARTPSMDLASSSGWIWDYADASASGPSFSPPEVLNPGSGSEPVDGGAPQALQLNPPTFSVPGGDYDYANFDLPVVFSNPNPPGASEIFYSVGGSEFLLFDGSPVLVGPGESLMAQTITIDPDSWRDSDLVQEDYRSTFAITGTTSGQFSNAVGGADMVTGGSDNYFTWGTPGSGFVDPSWVLFNGASFLNVSADERFFLGSIDYYNGTIASGTGADGVGLSIELGFDGGSGSELFQYDINLINSQNLEGNTADESADYVQFGEIFAEVPMSLGGIDYNLILEFGEITGSGFATLDEFFVHEGETASGDLYGTLVRAWGEG